MLTNALVAESAEEYRNIPSDVVNRAVRKLDMLDAAISVEDMRVPPGNRLHALPLPAVG